MSLTILEPGLHSRIVDGGRPRSRHLGVPVGGAFDQDALGIGNALLGNDPAVAALEITLRGPILRADSNVGLVIFGAPFEVMIDDQPVLPGRPFSLAKGRICAIGATSDGMRGYVCVVGGFQVEEVLGSRSAFEPVKENTRLECAESDPPTRFLSSVSAWELFNPDQARGVLRVVDGPQASWFEWDQFADQRYLISANSDRMGIRLEGAALTMPSRELISEPVAPGAVQVTNDGQCIILGPDGQTIGGYPKIAHIIRADRSLLAQLRPHEEIRFHRVSPEEAEQINHAHDRELRQWFTRLNLAEPLRAVVSSGGSRERKPKTPGEGGGILRASL